MYQNYLVFFLIFYFPHLQRPWPQSKSMDLDLWKRETRSIFENLFLCFLMHFRFRSFYMDGDWSRQSGEYCREKDQGLHLGDIRISYRKINGSSEENERRFKSEKIIRIKTLICWFLETINIFKCHRDQIKELKDY